MLLDVSPSTAYLLDPERGIASTRTNYTASSHPKLFRQILLRTVCAITSLPAMLGAEGVERSTPQKFVGYLSI